MGNNPMIQFTKLAGIIPEKGSIKLTIKKNPNGTLTILFDSKHDLVEHPYTYEKDLKKQADDLKETRETLDKTLTLTASPEKLTESFEDHIQGRQVAARELADAVNQSTAELKAKIDELKKKTAAKTAAKTAPKPHDKEAACKTAKEAGNKGPAQEKKETQTAGTLFGTAAEDGKGTTEKASEAA